MADLLKAQPKHMRNLWGKATGERLWYARHGYDIQTPPSGRGMYGHGRVLPPDNRTPEHARAAAGLLLTKAARRMLHDGWNTERLALWLDLTRGSSWGHSRGSPDVQTPCWSHLAPMAVSPLAQGRGFEISLGRGSAINGSCGSR
jgi:DNA polymerase IV